MRQRHILRQFGFIRWGETCIVPQYAHNLALCLDQGWTGRLQVWIRDLPNSIEFAILDRSEYGHTPPNTKSFETLIKIDELLGEVRSRLIGIGSLSPGNGEKFHLITLNKATGGTP